MEKNTDLEALENHETAIRNLTDRTAGLVVQALESGASWTEIGNALGVSKQTAHARYGKLHANASRQEKALTAWREIMTQTPQLSATTAPSKKSDTPAPAPAKTKASNREDALDAQQEAIYSGYVNTAMQVIDWKADQDDAARNKCPYCEQKRHYNTQTGHWYVYRGCTLTAADHAQHAKQVTNA